MLTRMNNIKHVLISLCVVAVLCGLLVVSAACGSSSGEPCRTDANCKGDLICCPITRNPAIRGTCEQTCAEITIDDGGVGDASD